jgi:hypothetical protein
VTAQLKANEGVFKSSRTRSYNWKRKVVFSVTGYPSNAIFWASVVKAVVINFCFASEHRFIALHLNPKIKPPFSNGQFKQIKYLYYLVSNSGKLNPQSRICNSGLLLRLTQKQQTP